MAFFGFMESSKRLLTHLFPQSKSWRITSQHISIVVNATVKSSINHHMGMAANTRNGTFSSVRKSYRVKMANRAKKVSIMVIVAQLGDRRHLHDSAARFPKYDSQMIKFKSRFEKKDMAQ